MSSMTNAAIASLRVLSTSDTLRWEDIELQTCLAIIESEGADVVVDYVRTHQLGSDAIRSAKRPLLQALAHRTLLADFAYVPSGEFWMGSPETQIGRSAEEWFHRVVISRSLWVKKTPVTQGEYLCVTGENPSRNKRVGEGQDQLRCPVVGVKFSDACRYCNMYSRRLGIEEVYRLSPAIDIDWVRRDGEELFLRNADIVEWDRNAMGCRLLTEAEWEYACKAGTRTRIYGRYPEISGVVHDSGLGRQIRAVGQATPNQFGLFDMIGSRQEWVWDWYGQDYYRASSLVDPTGPDTGDERVLRGGSASPHVDFDGGGIFPDSHPPDLTGLDTSELPLWEGRSVHRTGMRGAPSRDRANPACRASYYSFRTALPMVPFHFGA